MSVASGVGERGWRDLSACRRVDDPEVFYADGSDVLREHEAKMVCASCEVRDECFSDTMLVEDVSSDALRFGIRAGLTPRERAAWARAKKRSTSASM